MQVVKVIYFDSATNKFDPVALVKVPAHQTGFNSGDTDACEYAFTRTQNIFGSWSRGPTFDSGEHNEDFSENVEVIAPLPRDGRGVEWGLRSSMVGDLFVVNGNIYICKILGFELYEQEI